jgi:hypothetical protein
MRCPYCAEEIQPEAVKCKHCGEWLVTAGAPVFSSTSHKDDRLDNSRINLYTVLLKAYGTQPPKYLTLRADNETMVRAFIEEKYGGWYVDEKHGIRIKQPSKYSCPNCRYKYPELKRDIGCAALIIIFISLGLGLIIIPFLPYHCRCEACGHAWKA